MHVCVMEAGGGACVCDGGGVGVHVCVMEYVMEGVYGYIPMCICKSHLHKYDNRCLHVR